MNRNSIPNSLKKAFEQADSFDLKYELKFEIEYNQQSFKSLSLGHLFEEDAYSQFNPNSEMKPGHHRVNTDKKSEKTGYNIINSPGYGEDDMIYISPMKTANRETPVYHVAFRDNVSNNLLNFGVNDDQDLNQGSDIEQFDILVENSKDG